jgi:S1-C subfamily serine protease
MHFQAWFRLTRKPGEKVPIVVLRDGERHEVQLTVLD